MNSIVCTLYEKDYHLGVAALVNSLYKNDFRGNIYIGYRGELPPWAKDKAEVDDEFNWNSVVYRFEIVPKVTLFFLKITTERHLAHYKPRFMLDLMNILDPDANGGIFYFDPDIVIKCKWSFYEKWIDFGVTLIHEIVSIDMPPNHPTRKQWECVIEECGRNVTRSLYHYLNCGFCGVSRSNIEFLELWDYYIQKAVTVYGQDEKVFSTFDRTGSFWSLDQDTFNMVAMSCNCEISEMGAEAMDFIRGGWTMSHATGSPKPWQKNYLKQMFIARPPSLADKAFWTNANTPIVCFSPYQVKVKMFVIQVASFVGRFYKRY